MIKTHSQSIRSEQMQHGSNYQPHEAIDVDGNAIMAWVHNNGDTANTILKVTSPNGAVDSWEIEPDKQFKGDDMSVLLYNNQLRIIQTAHQNVSVTPRPNDHCLIVFERQAPGSRPVYKQVFPAGG